MALPKETTEKLIQLRKRNEINQEIMETREMYADAANPILRMYPIPEFREKLLYYKIDLMLFEDSVHIKANLRTEATVTYNFNEEDSTSSGTRGFMNMMGPLQFHNKHNKPSNVIASKMSPHPFYMDMKSVRKDFLKRYKDRSMVVEPYMCNFHLSSDKREGTYDFACAIVALEKNCDADVYVRIGDWEFHESIPLYSEKTIKRKQCFIYTCIENIRDFNPNRRSL